MAVLMFTGVLSPMLNSSNAKSRGPAGLPVGSDLVIDDTQEDTLDEGDGSRSGPSPC